MTLPANAAASSSKTPMIHVRENSFEPAYINTLDQGQRGAGDAVIIDNGSDFLRAGFASSAEPYINQPNLISRYTSRKNTKVVLFGYDTEVDSASKASAKSPFDGDLLVNFDVMESALDYTFLKLGLSSLPPVYMTERLACPLYCRSQTSELLFETYHAPSVCYGIDSLMAFSHLPASIERESTRKKGRKSIGEGPMPWAGRRDGLVINLGNVSSSLIPVLNGKAMMNRAKRIPWGGTQASELTLKLAQMKYPGFPLRVTNDQATFMFRETAYFSQNYAEELESLAIPANLGEIDRIVQFDYPMPESNTKTEEELATIAEKKKEQGRRLQEMAVKQRAEKALQRELQLLEMQELKALKGNLEGPDFEVELGNAGYEDEQSLDKAMKQLEAAMKKSRKDGDLDGMEVDEPNFGLVDIPDDQLDEEQKKEKRRQRMMKGAFDARMKVKAEKLAEQERMAELARLDDEARDADLNAWAGKLKEEHATTIARMKERKKKRSLLGDRKSAVAQNRMKSIANLASETPVAPKKRKRGGDDDKFGADDADWMVYREIDGGEDSDAEAEDQQRILQIETRLLAHDPLFTQASTLAAQQSRQTALITAFLRGKEDAVYDPDDVAQAYQLHLNVERIRVPEVWFQPQIAGVDSAGIGEIAGWLLNGFDNDDRTKMMQCIYVTGGSSLIPGLPERLKSTLTSLLPFQVPLNVVTSYPPDPRLEPWKGMATWSKTLDGMRASVTRGEWEERGGDYLKEHSWSNWGETGHED